VGVVLFTFAMARLSLIVKDAFMVILKTAMYGVVLLAAVFIIVFMAGQLSNDMKLELTQPQSAQDWLLSWVQKLPKSLV